MPYPFRLSYSPISRVDTRHNDTTSPLYNSARSISLIPTGNSLVTPRNNLSLLPNKYGKGNTAGESAPALAADEVTYLAIKRILWE